MYEKGGIMSICSNCGSEIKAGNKFCSQCGAEMSGSSAGNESCESATIAFCGTKYESTGSNSNGAYYTNSNNSFLHLKLYYQEEFSKIQDSNETYKGKWNWAAFLFGFFWLLSKGLWLTAIIGIILSLSTRGLLGIVAVIFIGFRGNYLYYNLVTKNRQL